MAIDYVLISLSDFLSSEEYSEDILLQAFNKFRCKREKDLEDFLRTKAIIKERLGISRTYLFIDNNKLIVGDINIIGFVSLATTSLNIRSLSQKQRRKILGNSVENRDNLESCPAFLIGQLGRDDSYTSDDLSGKILLYESISLFKHFQKSIAVADIVILECRPHMYNKFYKKHGFLEFPLENIANYGRFGENMVLAYLSEEYVASVGSARKLSIFKEADIEKQYGKLGLQIFEKYKSSFSLNDIEHTLKLASHMTKEYIAEINNEASEGLLTLFHRLSKIEFEVTEKKIG